MIYRWKSKFSPVPSAIIIVLIAISNFFVPEAGMAVMRAAESDISTRILNNWSFANSGKQLNIQLSFRLTNSGDVYAVKLIRGFENPSAIRSAIHAVVFAMPFAVQQGNANVVSCTISGDSGKPNVEVAISEAEPMQVNSAGNQQTEFYSYVAASRIAELCSRLYEVPDSAEALEELRKLCQSKSINFDNSQVWIDLGRVLSPTVTIQRNPPPSIEALCRGTAAAYLRACQLKRTKQNLYALEEGYAQLVALQVLKASKADPLLLASAAVLTYQFKMATDQYNQAIKEGSPSASVMFGQLVAQSGSMRYPEMASTPSSWEQLLYWLPEDSELLAVGTPATAQANPSKSFSLFTQVVTKNASMFEKLSDRVLETNKLFLDSKVAIALHSARRFQMPKGIGVGSSDSADILVFKDESKSLSRLVIEKIRTQQVATLQSEGTDILVFDDAPFTFARFCAGSNKEIAQFVCSPAEGVLISSNRIDFMRELLIRMRDSSAARSFPSSIPEWKLVDTSAETWGFRHYGLASSSHKLSALFASEDAEKSDKQLKLPVQDIGMCFALEPTRLEIKVLSNNEEYLKGLRTQWRTAFNNDGMHPVKDADAPGKTKSSISDHVMAIEGQLEQRNMAILMLINSLGYFVAI